MSTSPWLPTPDTDPVCGRTIDARFTIFKIAYGRITFYFCPQECMQNFTANPAKYLK